MAHSAFVRINVEHRAWWLLGCLAAYLLIHWMQHQGIGNEAIRFYAKDVLFIPTLLLSIEMGAQLLYRRIAIGGKRIFGAWLYVSIVFEGLLPLLSNRYHADYVDILAYGLGAFTFWRISRIEYQESTRH